MEKHQRALTLIKDDFFNELVKSQREFYISVILNSPENDIDVRERALIKIRALDEFIATIESLSKQGEINRKRFKIF